jgi:cell division septal protein FtsQ
MRRFEGVMARLPGAAWVRPQIVELVRQFAIPAAVRPTPWHYSKLLSGLILGVTLYALVAVHTQDEWFVYAEDVDFGRLIYLMSPDLYALGAFEGWNGLWLEPQVVAERLRSHPWIAAADVQVHLPARISAQIVERTPIAVWVTNRGTYWLAATGVALAMPPDQAAAADELMLPQLVDSLGEAQQLGVDRLAVDAATLESALALTAALPELEGKVRFNREVGLNFALSSPAVWVYFGNGHDMEIKLENLAAMRTVVLREENTARIIDVRYINRPYVR